MPGKEDKFRLMVLSSFRNEVNVTLNKNYFVGVSPEGIFRWELPRSYFDDYDIDKKYKMRIIGVDMI